jgi:hypothetical protein
VSGGENAAPPWAGAAIAAFVGVAVAATFLLVPPIPQDPAYHRFADNRTLLGVPHFWNVVTSLAFSLVGGVGLLRMARARALGARPEPAEWLFCAAVLLVGPGSAWYHLAPDNATLFWDRLPMTLGFMALTAALLGDALDAAWARRALWPLVVCGVVSVVYWLLTERAGAGDLRAYALVQFLPVLLIPLLAVLCGFRRYRAIYVGVVFVGYLLAKAAELGDAALYGFTDGNGGHSLKHLLAALACWFVVRMMLDRSDRPRVVA